MQNLFISFSYIRKPTDKVFKFAWLYLWKEHKTILENWQTLTTNNIAILSGIFDNLVFSYHSTVKQVLTMTQSNFDRFSLKKVNLNSLMIMRKNSNIAKTLNIIVETSWESLIFSKGGPIWLCSGPRYSSGKCNQFYQICKPTKSNNTKK